MVISFEYKRKENSEFWWAENRVEVSKCGFGVNLRVLRRYLQVVDNKFFRRRKRCLGFLSKSSEL